MKLCPRRAVILSLAAAPLAACAATRNPSASYSTTPAIEVSTKVSETSTQPLVEPSVRLPAPGGDASSAAIETATLPAVDPQIPAAPPRPNRYVQGMFGVSDFTVSDIKLDPSRGEIVDDNGMTLPMLGGVFQHPMSGDRVHLGFEGGFTFGWQGDVVGFSTGGGGAVVAVDNEVFLTDLFLGPYVDAPLGAKGRAYLAAGPLLQWANVDLDWNTALGHQHASDNGFGYGYYVRTGLEFMARPGLWLGFGARWVDARVDLSGELNDLDLEGIQYYLTVTENF
jgi:hypothetical protein